MGRVKAEYCTNSERVDCARGRAEGVKVVSQVANQC